MKKPISVMLILVMLVLLLGCGRNTAAGEGTGALEPSYSPETLQPEKPSAATRTPQEETDAAPSPEGDKPGAETTADPVQTSAEAEPPTEPAPETAAPPVENGGLCVAIDPGHQRRANREQEPVGPGASETKAKVGSGTAGPWSGTQEFELNLAVSLLLREELEQRGYRVVMTRTTHDVDISNAERARIAADAGADILVRIHADGSSDPAVHGALTVCMTKRSPYCADLYPESRRLSDEILTAMTAATGAKNRGVWETDTMTGINWATIPVTIVEMGYMSNEAEDRLMATEEYREKIARGIAEGIDRYFGRTAEVSVPEVPAGEEPAEEAAGLQAILDSFVQDRQEGWDVRVESLSADISAAASANAPAEHGFVSASIIKLYIAGAVYEDIEEGGLDHDSVIDDLKRMLQRSDNSAANRLTRALGDGDAEAGLARVTGFARSIGCQDTQHNRLMLDFNGKENYTSAKDCAIALRRIYEGQYVNSVWSAEMLSIMKGQVNHARINKYLPKGTVVADKTGTLYPQSNGGVGIVFSPKGDYIICMICNGYQNGDAVKESMAKLSREVYDWFQDR